MRHGISGTGYVASGKWALWSPSIRYTAMFCQEKVINLYRKLGFEGDELAVLSALTVGEKTDLSDSIRESYSVSGASHVLALSGLHIGLLYALLFLLLKPLARKWQAGRYFRSVLLLVLLWSFAFFTRSVAVCRPFGKYVLGFGNSGTVRTPIIDSEYTGCYRMGNAVGQSGLVVRCWFSIIFSSCTFYFDDSETGLSVVACEEQDRKICLGIDECIDSCANRNCSACNAVFLPFLHSFSAD